MNDNIPQQQYDAGQYQQGREHTPQSYGPRRKHLIARHIWRNFFRYFFFAVQAIFVIWLINGLNDAGQGITVGLIIGLWVAVDVILGIGRIFVLLGRRYIGAHR